MTYLTPSHQTKLIGLNKFINELIFLNKKKILPNKILLSGQKGLGKATLAYHFINYILSQNEKFSYNINNFEINKENQSFKTLLNKSNPNFFLIDVDFEKKNIDINQIRELILNLNKSSFNNKPRFVLIDNVELLNLNSINALLKILEEPSDNVFFILVNNQKNILSTLSSRCINFKISLTNKENLTISNQLLDKNLSEIFNVDLLNYYSTPGNIYNLVKFSQENKYDISKLGLKDLLKIIIKNKHYKKNDFIRFLFYDLIQLYFIKLNSSVSKKIYQEYSFFLKRISDTNKYNLDDESLFMEFEEKVLNG